MRCAQSTLTIVVVGPPVAVADSVVTSRDVAIVFSPLANDVRSDPSVAATALDPRSVTLVAQPASGGTVLLDSSTGSMRFVPTAGFTGSTSFSYQV